MVRGVAPAAGEDGIAQVLSVVIARRDNCPWETEEKGKESECAKRFVASIKPLSLKENISAIIVKGLYVYFRKHCGCNWVCTGYNLPWSPL